MPADHLWLCITALAAAIDGNPVTAEEALDKMEYDLIGFTKERRNEIHREMTVIVAQLARVEVRMMQTDGPVDGV
ncbi:MAG: hypothetical protein WD894_12535 [Pirellulales bacterium]